MRTPLRVALATALLAPLSVLAPAATPAGAAAAPTVSTTSGAPGTHVEVTVPDCSADGDDGFRYLQVLLISGTAPNEVLAGIGASAEGSASFVVPDWLDAAQPAVIESSCLDVTDVVDPDDEPVVTTYDPVSFDVLPGAGAPTQVATLSRSSLLAGQGFHVLGAGCTIPGADSGGAAVFPGSDRARRSFGDLVAEGGSGIDAGSFDVGVLLNGGGVGFGYSVSPDGVASELEVTEDGTDIPAGPYTVLPYCLDGAGTMVLYQPMPLVVTGSAPVDQVDLTVGASSHRATIAGRACTVGPVHVDLFGDEVQADEELDEFDADVDAGARTLAGTTAPHRSPFSAPTQRRSAPVVRGWSDGAPAAERGTRVISGDGEEGLEADVDPDGDGSWSASDTASFDQGLVLGYAICGDPDADGWFYDPQGAIVDARRATPPTTTPTTAPPTNPPAAGPAVAVPGSPTYAG